MNEDIVADFKQFISVTVSQQLAQFESKMDEKFQSLETNLSKKMKTRQPVSVMR